VSALAGAAQCACSFAAARGFGQVWTRYTNITMRSNALMTTVEEGKGEAPSDGEAAATASIIAMFSFAVERIGELIDELLFSGLLTTQLR